MIVRYDSGLVQIVRKSKSHFLQNGKEQQRERRKETLREREREREKEI